MGDQIEQLLQMNEGNVPQSLYDELNAAFDEKTGDYNLTKLNAFLKKNDALLQTLKGYNEFDWNVDKPLKERLAGTNYTQRDPNYIEGLSLRYNATPEEIISTLDALQADKEAAKEKQKIADEYKREAEARYARQKAVDDYQHSYLGMDLDNPLNKGLNWLADAIISDKTKRAVVEDPNASGRIAGNVATDIIGTGLDFAPGYGYLLAPVVRTGRNIAEGDKASDVVKEAAADVIGSLALDKGVKGLPVARDLGPLHKVEEKIPLNEWAAKAKTAKTPVKNVALELPPADPKEIGKWIEKQPAELRKEYYKVIEENPSNVREALIKKIDELGDIANKDTYKQMIAEQWVKENPVKAKTGIVAEQGTLGTERILAVKPFQTETEYKTSNHKKIKTYDDAIGFIIDSNKRQWEAGFKPRDMSGIVGDAYRKWESER
ncbi:MAG: hypothetical protein MJZ37_06920 [Bacilli bacterium]|nr:hypothetical protein [Bacilli bacterium]